MKKLPYYHIFNITDLSQKKIEWHIEESQEKMGGRDFISSKIDFPLEKGKNCHQHARPGNFVAMSPPEKFAKQNTSDHLNN